MILMINKIIIIVVILQLKNQKKADSAPLLRLEGPSTAVISSTIKYLGPQIKLGPRTNHQ